MSLCEYVLWTMVVVVVPCTTVMSMHGGNCRATEVTVLEMYCYVPVGECSMWVHDKILVGQVSEM